MTGAPLPITPVLGAVAAALRSRGVAVLQAPPGAGKTTAVPLHLLDTIPGRILMLEPRRVAARAAAERLAETLGERPGGRVGYRFRGDSRSGSRIEVVTEGVLTRMLQSDPELPGVGCVIFDEFHERGLQADLGLALALEARGALRPDLAILVMSATLDAAPVAALLGEAPLITAEGRAHAVETRWLDRPRGEVRLEAAVTALTLDALAATEGGVLVFLPGQAEIGRTAAALAPHLGAGVTLQPLHGGLSLADQRAALAPLGGGARKLVLATSIAETSLTIPDVRVVVDAGLARRARFDPGSGMSRLVTERVTRAEAEQRRGRAGRVAPGWCFRLWTKGEDGALAAFPPPEIASADLTSLALELAIWGAPDGAGLAFLTPPPAPALAEAQALLRDLGALAPGGGVTAHGRSLAATPAHPRLGHMLAVAPGRLAADLAALVEARDPVRGRGGRAPADLGLRLLALRDPARAEAEAPVTVDRGAVAAIRAEARRLLAPEGAGDRSPGPSAGLSPGAVLSLAYPDRIARRREGPAPRYLLASGKGAVLDAADPLGTAPFLVAADLDGDPREALVRRALPVTEAELRALHADRLGQERAVEWSRRTRAVVARDRLMLGAIALEDRPWRDAPAAAVAAALAAGVRDLGLGVLPWTEAARRLQARTGFLRGRGEDLPDLSDEGLAATPQDWLAPHLGGMRRIEDLARLDLRAILEATLDWPMRERLDRLAPASLEAPTGTRLPIDYSGGAPAVAVRLQEMFGTTLHPTAAGVPVVFDLLSPAGRPVQTTTDLPGFWRTSYAEVRRDLRGRYPRHPWPEDPAAAAPTRRAKPRGT